MSASHTPPCLGVSKCGFTDLIPGLHRGYHSDHVPRIIRSNVGKSWEAVRLWLPTEFDHPVSGTVDRVCHVFPSDDPPSVCRIRGARDLKTFSSRVLDGHLVH